MRYRIRAYEAKDEKIGYVKKRSKAENLLQNNNLSLERLLPTCLPRLAPSRGYLIISNWWCHNSASRDVQENGLPGLVLHFAKLLCDMAPYLVLLFHPIKCLINYPVRGQRVVALSCRHVCNLSRSSLR